MTDKLEDVMQFVEDVGLLLENAGLPRMSGRVLGWLLVSDPREQSFQQLTDALQASKGSISASTNTLIRIGLIERMSKPGDRKDYFRIPDGAWRELIRTRIRAIREVVNLAERGLELTSDRPEDDRQSLQEMREVYTEVHAALKELVTASTE